MVRKTTVMIKPSIKKIVQEYKSALQDLGVEFNQVVLFGSQINGRVHKDSDIDICVVSPQFGRDWMKEEIKLKDLAMNVDIRIEPHPYSVKDFQVEEDPFAYEIRKTGVVI
jgi:predicted nucleotidyltransferase